MFAKQCVPVMVSVSSTVRSARKINQSGTGIASKANGPLIRLGFDFSIFRHMDKYKAKCVSMKDVMVELGLVPFPPKQEGDECECGCKISESRLVYCGEHQPIPA